MFHRQSYLAVCLALASDTKPKAACVLFSDSLEAFGQSKIRNLYIVPGRVSETLEQQRPEKVIEHL